MGFHTFHPRAHLEVTDLLVPRNWFFCVGGLQLKFGCHRKASLSCARNWSDPFPGSWSGKIRDGYVDMLVFLDFRVEQDNF